MEEQRFNLFLFKTVFLPLTRVVLWWFLVLQLIAYDQYWCSLDKIRLNTSSCSGITNRKKWATMYHMLTGKNDFTRLLQHLELSFARWLTTKDCLQDYWWRRTFTSRNLVSCATPNFYCFCFQSVLFFVNPFYCSPCFCCLPQIL